jgi:hypothetical protein
MGAVWLNGRTAGYPSVLDVLRNAGVKVATEPGWESRSRSTGGFDGLWGIVCHHTASNTSPANDIRYMVTASDGPVANGLLDRSGLFTITAGGASNHAGKGGGSADGGGTPWRTSRGTIPADNANRYAFGIEGANAGQGGDPWPKAQQDTYVAMCAALCAAYGLNPATDIRSHAEWTPPRKVDPRGPARWQPANANSPWTMDPFRADVAAAMAGAPTPEDDDMPGWLYRDSRYSNVFVRGQGPATPVTTEELQGGGVGAKLGATVVATHDGVLAALCEQAWGMTVDEARAAKLLA